MFTDRCSDRSTGGSLNMNWDRGMSTESTQSANLSPRENRSRAVFLARTERRRRGVEDRASEERGGTLRPGLKHAPSAEPWLAWVAEAPLLPGERGVHIASRIGIVAVEAAGESDVVHNRRCCRQRRNSPGCACCPVTGCFNRKQS